MFAYDPALGTMTDADLCCLKYVISLKRFFFCMPLIKGSYDILQHEGVVMSLELESSVSK